MGKYTIEDTTLKNISGAIKEKTQNTSPLAVKDFATAIQGITTGGGGEQPSGGEPYVIAAASGMWNGSDQWGQSLSLHVPANTLLVAFGMSRYSVNSDFQIDENHTTVPFTPVSMEGFPSYMTEDGLYCYTAMSKEGLNRVQINFTKCYPQWVFLIAIANATSVKINQGYRLRQNNYVEHIGYEYELKKKGNKSSIWVCMDNYWDTSNKLRPWVNYKDEDYPDRPMCLMEVPVERQAYAYANPSKLDRRKVSVFLDMGILKDGDKIIFAGPTYNDDNCRFAQIDIE